MLMTTGNYAENFSSFPFHPTPQNPRSPRWLGNEEVVAVGSFNLSTASIHIVV
jgi:hypothetical protein